MNSYAHRLQHAMDLAHLDRKTVAGALGISVQALGRVLNGQSKAMSAANSTTTARLCKVDPHWLATGEGEPRPRPLSTEAMHVAEIYDRLTPEAQRQFWLLLQVVQPVNAVNPKE